MANKLLLCLLVVCVLIGLSENRRFGGGSRSRGGSSWSSSRHSYPSSSGHSGSSHRYSGSSSSSSHKYPSSSSGLSGTGGSHHYPSSSSGLSGSGASNNYRPSGSGSGNSYPPSSGLSGSWTGSGSNKYPQSPGLSGTGSGSSKYPVSPGLSGTGSESNKYPLSPGLSGTSSGTNKYPSYTSGSNGYKYPQHTDTSYKPTYNTNAGVGSRPIHTSNNYGHGNIPPSYGHGMFYNPPTYYSAPQHVYVTEYRNSGSKYSDLLTGLALYNMGRSHSHHHDHYYYDDYYKQRYHSSSNSYRPYEKPKDEAHCLLRITEKDKSEVLKIPCEIVSTFTQEGKKVASGYTTVCQTNVTVVNNSIPVIKLNTTPVVENTSMPLNTSTLLGNATISVNSSLYANESSIQKNSTNDSFLNATVDPNEFFHNKSLDASSLLTQLNNSLSTVEKVKFNSINQTSTTSNDTLISNNTVAPVTTSFIENSSNYKKIIDLINDLESKLSASVTTPASINISYTTEKNIIQDNIVKPAQTTEGTKVNSSITTVNTTVCTQTTNPLSLTGPPVNASNIACVIEIITKDSHLTNKVDCNTLVKYAKMPEPKKENTLVPSRDKLKSWLSHPPWWLSVFIAL